MDECEICAKTMDINFVKGETKEASTDLIVSSRPTLSGGDYVDLDGFIAVVINSVNDLVIDGFNNMEEFVAQTLDLESEPDRRALKEGVDSLYNKVQDNIDENLNWWESICRDRYFNNFPSKNPLNTSNSKKTTRDAGKNCSKPSCVEDVQEELLDSELRSLRSQLVAAHRERAKMRRELTSLEKQLVLRRQVLSDAKSLDASYDADMLEGLTCVEGKGRKLSLSLIRDLVFRFLNPYPVYNLARHFYTEVVINFMVGVTEVIKSAYLLKDTMKKANGFQEQSCLRTRLQELRSCLAEQPLEEVLCALKMPSHVELGDTATINLLS